MPKLPITGVRQEKTSRSRTRYLPRSREWREKDEGAGPPPLPIHRRLLAHAKSKTQLHANVSPASPSGWEHGFPEFCFLYAVGEDNALLSSS